MKNLRVVFMGTPEFAVATLGSLLMNGFNIVSVVTSPDKPAGRGLNVTKSAVGKYADENLLPVLQPENLKDPDFIARLEKLNADVFIVVAFRMLPKEVWQIPPRGTINLHASLLPQYRGAAPINHAVINGEPVTGVTTFIIDDKIDTGNILLRQEVKVSPEENAGDLHDKLMKHGARLIVKTLSGIVGGCLHPQPQSNFMIPGEILKKAPRIFPEDCFINWDGDPLRIHNFIRGLAPYPGARTCFKSEEKAIQVKLFESRPVKEGHNYSPGQIMSDGKTHLKVVCRGGFIEILSLQAAGKSRMTAIEFLRGFRIEGFDKAVSQGT